MKRKQLTSIRLDSDVKALLQALMEHWDLSQTAVLTMLICQAARQHGILPSAPEQYAGMSPAQLLARLVDSSAFCACENHPKEL